MERISSVRMLVITALAGIVVLGTCVGYANTMRSGSGLLNQIFQTLQFSAKIDLFGGYNEEERTTSGYVINYRGSSYGVHIEPNLSFEVLEWLSVSSSVNARYYTISGNHLSSSMDGSITSINLSLKLVEWLHFVIGRTKEQSHQVVQFNGFEIGSKRTLDGYLLAIDLSSGKLSGSLSYEKLRGNVRQTNEYKWNEEMERLEVEGEIETQSTSWIFYVSGIFTRHILPEDKYRDTETYAMKLGAEVPISRSQSWRFFTEGSYLVGFDVLPGSYGKGWEVIMGLRGKI